MRRDWSICWAATSLASRPRVNWNRADLLQCRVRILLLLVRCGSPVELYTDGEGRLGRCRARAELRRQSGGDDTVQDLAQYSIPGLQEVLSL